IPCCRSESARAAISAASNWRLGWNGFGSIWSTAMWSRSPVSSELGSKPPSSRPSSASSPRPSRRLVLFTIDDLHRELRVSPGAPCPGCVVEHTHTVARCFTNMNISRNHGVEDGAVEVFADLARDLVGEVEGGVEHGEDE